MATYDWPAAFYPSQMTWGNRKAGVQFASPYNGTRQSVEFAAERWLATVTLPPAIWADSAKIEAFFERLAGGVNRVRLWHRTRPIPRGSMRGTPTVGATATRGDQTITISTMSGATLYAGDLFSAGGQLFKAADDCVANGSGALVVPLVHRVRASTAIGTAVTWDHPTADFVMMAMGGSITYNPVVSDQVAYDFEEVW